MHKSHPITFAGAAITQDGKLRFIAVDPRVEELDHSVWPTLSDVERVVQHLFTTGRLPARQTGLGDSGLGDRR